MSPLKPALPTCIVCNKCSRKLPKLLHVIRKIKNIVHECLYMLTSVLSGEPFNISGTVASNLVATVSSACTMIGTWQTCLVEMPATLLQNTYNQNTTIQPWTLPVKDKLDIHNAGLSPQCHLVANHVSVTEAPQPLIIHTRPNSSEIKWNFAVLSEHLRKTC